MEEEITMGQVRELFEQSKEKNGHRRINRQNAQAFLRNPDRFNTGKFEPRKPDVYSITVDYDKGIEKMIDAGCYSHVSIDCLNQDDGNYNRVVENLYETNITTMKAAENKAGKTTITVELINPNKVVSSDDFLCYLKENGLRPASLPEFLSFLSSHHELPVGTSVIACLDSFMHEDYSSEGEEDRLTFCAVRSGWDSRMLRAVDYYENWSQDTNFLAVRESVQAPQPLKTFLLFEEIHDPTVPGPDPRKILATIQATDEKAAAAHLGGEYIRFLGPLDNGPSILLPRKLFKPCGKYRTRDMMEFRQDGLYICIDARCAEHYIRIEEVPNIIAS
ncbi:hypothetical protein A2303_02800 [Candidatus Falkowbacteria bacterium RIFOXYB2_FULL_47_14]|uniref:Uncharacterized protein n=1 Tax=Candidatus Falkowbacteria bacterium RIFOXYA2_FULL_47_19 TaxID=1797994 RepID=A0A1F5SLL5_9BACT|nr:MAG: hypothetical protein A2227_01875 [Candidatus Falkowbacteria bacterium RIFOXYA2_FULL_47_19]OGF36245.1 MAG: hypothetical protein A2468_07545 [Candidatus Falkowbacteria bacterium RIFOXYC2_FULL_46_15]OGF43049.1 MAG: hypothetical protein A2303_02800 [Candidatus Falkowbacteria bacterium RIFOXYB2_FULL_47_14]